MNEKEENTTQVVCVIKKNIKSDDEFWTFNVMVISAENEIGQFKFQLMHFRVH